MCILDCLSLVALDFLPVLLLILLEVDKYAPDKSSKWRRVNARFPALYKALLVDPDADTRGARLGQAVSAAG